MVHLPDEIERVHLKHLADEKPNLVLLDSLDESGNKRSLVDDSFTLNGLRHFKCRLVELDRLITGNQKLLRVPCSDPHVPVRPENPVASRVHFGGLAVLYFCHQFGDGPGKPTDRIVDTELVGTVRINLAAARAVEQKFARFARFADPREIAENVESRLVPDCLNRLARQGAESELRLIAHPEFSLGVDRAEIRANPAVRSDALDDHPLVQTVRNGGAKPDTPPKDREVMLGLDDLSHGDVELLASWFQTVAAGVDCSDAAILVAIDID